MSAKLCWAADVKYLHEARKIVRSAGDYIDIVKVGPELLVGCGLPALDFGKPIFLDLKLHDIPETVERTILRAGAHGQVMYMTIHAQQRATMERAAEAAEKVGITLLCVTVLTSMTERDGQELDYQRTWPHDRAVRMIELAISCGVKGFVCSPEEVSLLRKEAANSLFNQVDRKAEQLNLHPEPIPLLEECKKTIGSEFTFVTPGIRSNTQNTGSLQDQKRVGSPTRAVLEGSNILVVGRPIRDAANPTEAAEMIRLEMDNARHYSEMNLD